MAFLLRHRPTVADDTSLVEASARLAYACLVGGHAARAVRVLEGDAAERFVIAAAPLVRDGRLSLEQFQLHVTELHEQGCTVVRDPGEDAHTAALVENLAAQQRLARAIEAGAAVDARTLNRLVRERERLVSRPPAHTLVEGWLFAPARAA